MKNNFFLNLFLIMLCYSLWSCNAQTKSAQAKKDTTLPSSAATNSLARLDSAQIMNDIQYLASDKLEGRGTDTKGIRLAQDFITQRFADLGLEKFGKDYFQDFTFSQGTKKYNCRNIVGKITGTRYPEKYIVLTAHYDHLGVRDEKIFNGADDNASGVTAILATAEFFKKNPPRHSILFVTFDAEEMGLQGAKYFVDNSPVDLEKIKLNINFDMISRNEKNEIYIAGTHHYPILKEKLTHIDKASDLNVKFGHDRPIFGFGDWTNASDHAAFHKKQIPFLYLGVEDHEDYHKHTDTFENIDPAFLYRSTNLVVELVKAFD